MDSKSGETDGQSVDGSKNYFKLKSFKLEGVAECAS